MVVYMDVLETTNRQFLKFLNKVGDQGKGGAKWIDLNDSSRVTLNLMKAQNPIAWSNMPTTCQSVP